MRFHLPALCAAMLVAAAPADAATRSFTVTSFDRIRVEGPFKVEVSTNVAPFARATGPAGALDSLSMTVQGQTLVIRRNGAARTSGSASREPVAISVGTHKLSRAWLTGSGTLAVDRLRGQTFDLAVEGAGRASVSAISVDQLKVAVAGSGVASLGGQAGEVRATVQGTGTLDAAALTATNANIGVDGPSVLRLTVRDTAKLTANGPATIELDGRPACTLKAGPSAEVSGCR